MELKKYKLYEIADLNKNSISNSNNTFSEIIYLDTSSITENVISGTCVVSTHEAPSRAQRRVEKNTILYSTVRPRLKHYGILLSPETNLIVSTGFVTIDVKSEFLNSVDARFLFLLLTQPHITEHIASIADSAVSAYPSFNPSDISALEFEFPKMNIQKHIADIWEHYDRKIELNRQINDNLEAMAKQLYDYWFVQFDFPNEEGKPYKSSGGAMVWNEKLKREIPQGVDAKKIGDIENNIITGKTPSCADEDNFGGDIPFVTIDDIRGNLFVFEAQRTLSIKGADSQEKKYLPIGSLSVSCIGTIGIMGFVVRLAQTNQQINSIVFEHEYNKEFLYFSLRLYFENAKAKTGNVFANMSKEEFASIIVAYPPMQTLQAFHNKVAPIFDSIKNNIEEINTLTKQRDELLPLLMNGQATVNYHLSDD